MIVGFVEDLIVSVCWATSLPTCNNHISCKRELTLMIKKNYSLLAYVQIAFDLTQKKNIRFSLAS